MDNLNQYRSDLDQLTALIDKLSKGELTIDELTKLEELSRRLHERSIILKYKAFEQHSSGKKIAVKEEEVTEEKEEEDPAFDLSIFDQENDDEEDEMDVTFDEEEELEEPVDDIIEDEEEEGEVIEDEIMLEPAKSDDNRSFIDQLNLQDNSIASKLAGGKLDSLVGAFGLNERLRFINNLFDGSSELFSDAVKSLDSQNDFNGAKEQIDDLAKEHSWDPEDDSVLEFMNYINRRYA